MLLGTQPPVPSPRSLRAVIVTPLPSLHAGGNFLIACQTSHRGAIDPVTPAQVIKNEERYCLNGRGACEAPAVKTCVFVSLLLQPTEELLQTWEV